MVDKCAGPWISGYTSMVRSGFSTVGLHFHGLYTDEGLFQSPGFAENERVALRNIWGRHAKRIHPTCLEKPRARKMEDGHGSLLMSCVAVASFFARNRFSSPSPTLSTARYIFLRPRSLGIIRCKGEGNSLVLNSLLHSSRCLHLSSAFSFPMWPKSDEIHNITKSFTRARS